MPKPTRGPRLGSGPAHEHLILAGLAAELFRQERIRTTETKAKRLRPVAERLITWGKAGTVHARRQALAVIEDRDVVHKLFSDIAPRFSHRDGGYTRILKLGPRKGDAAMMALIELVEGEVEEQAAQAEEASPAPRRRGVLGRRGSRAASSGKSEELAEDAVEVPETTTRDGEERIEMASEPPLEDAEALPADEPSAQEADALPADEPSAQEADAGPVPEGPPDPESSEKPPE